MSDSTDSVNALNSPSSIAEKLSNRRQLCEGCQKPLSTCFCDLVSKTNSQTEVIILQHPGEAHHAKNTGYFLSKCLINARVLAGEVFSSEEPPLSELLNDGKLNLLLYPPTPDSQSVGTFLSPILNEAEVRNCIKQQKNTVRLWCIDATWKKSRKMLYVNPWIQTFPRVNLSSKPSSRYRIRKAEGEYQLSTFEAVCYALKYSEEHFDETELIKLFDQFIQRIEQFRP